MSQELLEQFLTEGRDLIEDASGGLLALEQSPTDEQVINQVFRSVHTLKGNAGLFDYPALIELLHAGEELMVAVRESQVKLTAEMVDSLLAASDVVRNFLDEIEQNAALDPRSEEEGRKIAGIMSSYLGSGDKSGQEGDSEAKVALPDWTLHLPSDALEAGTTAVIFEYIPDSSCFFRGEDPLQIAAQVDKVIWRSVRLNSQEKDVDPFACHLTLRAMTLEPLQVVKDNLRYVEDEVKAWVVSAEDLEREVSSQVAASPARGTTAVAAVLIERQSAVLEHWKYEDAASVASVLRLSFEHMGDAEGVASVSACGTAPTVQQMQGVIEAWKARREAEAAKALAVSSKPSEKKGAGDASSGGGGGASSASRVLRVDQSKVDRLMNLIGQMVVAKNALPYMIRKMSDGTQDPKLLVRELKEHSGIIDRITRELQSAIMEVRMLPVSQVFQRFPRLVRDISRKLDKEIELVLVGEDTQADKNIIEALSEPLVHIVRNSLDHGIEMPEERTAKGKPASGTIRLSARNENETVVITIEDDGRGLDATAIRKKAVEKGVLSEEDAERLSEQDSKMLIFAAGFSTKDAATELSGRGVGMDVVKTTIEKVGGRLSLESEVGAGTKITLGLPLSMAVSHVMTVTVEGQLYGIGMDSVVETVRYPSDQIRNIKGREALVLRDELLPVIRLRRLLGLHAHGKQNAYGEEAVLVLRDGAENIGLVVDEFGENIEVLVRPLDGWMGQMQEYSGSAVLGDGRLLLVLDMRELIRNGV